MDDKQKGDLLLREMERKSNDTIKIYNPTIEDYPIRWSGRYWIVPNKSKDSNYGKGCLDVPRYLAMHYIKHMTDKLITEESDKLVAKEKAKYRGTRWPEEELRIALKTNNPDLRKKYIKILWKGVVEKFGMDELPSDLGGSEAKPKDTRPQDEVLLEEVELIDLEQPQDKKDKPKDDFASAIS